MCLTVWKEPGDEIMDFAVPYQLFLCYANVTTAEIVHSKSVSFKPFMDAASLAMSYSYRTTVVSHCSRHLGIPETTRTTHEVVPYSDIVLWDTALTDHLRSHDETGPGLINFVLPSRSRKVISRVSCQCLHIRKFPLVLMDGVKSDSVREAVSWSGTVGR